MKRRQFLSAGAIGAVGTAIAAPALAQSASPELKWRLTVGGAKSGDLPYAAAEVFARLVGEATDGRFQIQLVPSPDAGPVLDAVANGTVDAGYESLSTSFGKNPALALLSSVPFGLNTRGQSAWFVAGGGLDLANEVLAKSGLYGLPGGNVGASMGAWSRRELRSLDAIRGLKVRAPGFAGSVFERLGAAPQSSTAAEAIAALRGGTLDAAISSGPIEDERSVLAKAAPFIHYPGWWEGGATLFFLFNAAKWRELTKPYQAVVNAAAAAAGLDLTARHDARNPAALRRLVGAGAQLRAFPQEVLEAAYKAASDLCSELSAGNADFKTLWDSIRAFRGEEYLWFQVAEYTFDNFMIRARARGG